MDKPSVRELQEFQNELDRVAPVIGFGKRLVTVIENGAKEIKVVADLKNPTNECFYLKDGKCTNKWTLKGKPCDRYECDIIIDLQIASMQDDY